jgi:hypothetical protein
MSRGFFTAVFLIALLWPSRVLTIFDGLPLNGTAEAIALGLMVPVLWIVSPRFLDLAWVRIAVFLLLVVKVAGAAMLTQQGLCARFSTTAPYRTQVLTIPIEEPRGFLRSWDVRAAWQSESPRCTAIVDRPYSSLGAFPVWFLNITDFVSDLEGHRTDTVPRRLSMEVSGAIDVPASGTLSIALDRDVALTGRIGSSDIASSGGSPVVVALDPGVHPMALEMRLTGSAWKFVPTWNGRDAFRTSTLTVDRPGALDRWLAPVLGFAASALVAVLLAGWTALLIGDYRASPLLLAWTALASGVLAVAAATGRLDRFAVLLLLAAPFVPVASAHRNWRGGILLAGVPWLVFFGARSLTQIGHITAYSVDDWLAYQAAAYRIYMNGYWLEAGSKLFDYQPLYRWISGALHLIFGDSSVGEAYWDALCLLGGGMLAFTIVAPRGGFRLAVAAASITLSLFAVGTIWYFIGRGLSEISAAGFGFAASLCLLGSGADWRIAATAGLLAALMFYTRLNHLVFGAVLVVLLLPAGLVTACRQVKSASWRVFLRPASAYLATFAAGVALFALRTWWYTGVFSVFLGTSLKNNDIGLRPSTIASPEVWSRIRHSLGALVWMNEPPHPDVRAVVVVVGVGVALLVLFQVPRLKELPLSLALVVVGALASSLVTHTHNYPGRMSIHLVPFAVAMAVAATGLLNTARLDVPSPGVPTA